MFKQKTKLPLTLPVEISYELLPATYEQGMYFPTAIDIQEILVETLTANGKSRKINILSALKEDAIIALEDEILDELGYS